MAKAASHRDYFWQGAEQQQLCSQCLQKALMTTTITTANRHGEMLNNWLLQPLIYQKPQPFQVAEHPWHILIREQKGSPFFSWFPAGELASCWHNRSNLDNNRASRHTKSQRQKRSNYPSEAFSLVIALDQNTASEPPSLEALQYSWDLNWDFVPWVHAIFHETLGIRLVLQASQRRRERET